MNEMDLFFNIGRQWNNDLLGRFLVTREEIIFTVVRKKMVRNTGKLLYCCVTICSTIQIESSLRSNKEYKEYVTFSKMSLYFRQTALGRCSLLLIVDLVKLDWVTYLS